MRLTEFAFASFFLLASHAVLAQEEDLIDDLPRAFKEAAKATQKTKQPKNGQPSATEKLPVAQPNTDLIDDLSPEQKRAAAERTEARKIENLIPDNLGEALARALHNSPVILVADAKVRQAQAELNEARQSVVHDLTLAFKRRARNKESLEYVPTADAHEPRRAILESAILEDEAKIVYLLGIVGERVGIDFGDHTATARALEWLVRQQAEDAHGASDGKQGLKTESAAGRPSENNPQPTAFMMSALMGMRGAGASDSKSLNVSLRNLPENVRSFLNKRIDVDFQEQPIKDVLEYIRETGGGEVDFVNSEIWGPDEGRIDSCLVTLRIKRVTIAATLQALADLHGCAFVFRDYGILVIGPRDTDPMVESYRATGAPMIAPPEQVQMGGGLQMMPGMGGMIGPDGAGAGLINSPGSPPAEE